MNICLLSKSYVQATGGIESYTRILSATLAARGHRVHIVAQADDNGSEVLPGGITIHRIRHRELDFWGVWRLERVFPASWITYSWNAFLQLTKIIRENRIDVVESPNWCIDGFWYGIMRSVPLVVRLHVCTPEYARLNVMQTEARAQVVMRMEKIFLSRADAITAPSRYISREIAGAYHIKSDVSVIPNCIDDTIFGPDPSAESREPSILFVGRLEENKGIEYLAQAIPIVLRRVPNATFVFVGQDAPFPSNKKKVWGAYLKGLYGDRIRLLAQMKPRELADAYRSCWAYVVPSLSEAFGLTAVEAMACGKPVVASNLGGLREIVEDGVNGMLVRPADGDALGGALLKLLEDTDFRKRLGRNALWKPKALYTPHAMADNTIFAYESARERFHRCWRQNIVRGYHGF